MQGLVEEMEVLGLQPDSYTFVTLLTALSRASSSVMVVEGLITEMRKRGIQASAWDAWRCM